MIKYYVEGEHSPQTATDGSAGLDLFVNNISTDQLTLGTGVHVEIPEGHVGLVLPRSSWGLKGFQLSNTCGVIDSDYRGEIKLARDIHPTKAHLFTEDTEKQLRRFLGWSSCVALGEIGLDDTAYSRGATKEVQQKVS